MNQRQEQLLYLVIHNYILHAEPVGSKFLVSDAGVELSEATVRNELRDLEEQGYLTHPHTSAGRIPTALGYRYYVNRLGGMPTPKSGSPAGLDEKLAELKQDAHPAKKLARFLSEVTLETVCLSASADQLYFTGFTYLFQKPDFANLGSINNISSVFDHFDESLPKIFPRLTQEPQYFIGDEHPLGSELSILAARFGKDLGSTLILFGPIRMNYQKNYFYMKKILELI